MSYALRNTLILLVTLLIIAGGGFVYYKFFLEGRIESLQQEVETKRKDLTSKQNINNQYEELNTAYEAALRIVSNYDKALYPVNKPDDVYDFLNSVNMEGGNQITYDFVFQDSIAEDQYGIMNSTITGFADFRPFVDFVNRIENSQLLNKVTALTVSPGRQEDGLSSVNFSLNLESYYQKTPLLDSLVMANRIEMNDQISTYNPLYPLIQPTVQPNDEGLVSVESSRMIGLTSNRVFLSTSEGIVSLKEGDRVYLGTVESIDLNNRTATFNLNKGGIQERVTLEVEQ
jgi:hypothetical protein